MESRQIRRPLRVYLETHLAHVELIKSETQKEHDYEHITVDRDDAGLLALRGIRSIE